MKIRDVIAEYEGLRQSPMPANTLVKIISRTEEEIKKNIVNIAEDAEDYPFEGYTVADLDRELLAPPPYDMIYVWACCEKHDLRENQTLNAANSRELYRDIFGKLSAYWMRAHRPKKTVFVDTAEYL